MQRQIKDKQGVEHTIIMDEEDVEYYDSQTWTSPYDNFSVKNEEIGKLFHRILMNATDKEFIIFSNGDKHDFRKANLYRRPRGSKTTSETSATSSTAVVTERTPQYRLIVTSRQMNPIPLSRNMWGYYNYPKYTDLRSYDNSRLILLGWKVTDMANNSETPVMKKIYMIRNTTEVSLDRNLRYHGIRDETNRLIGRPVKDVLDEFLNDLKQLGKIQVWVGEDVQETKNILCNELYRLGYNDAIEMIKDIRNYDFDYHGKRIMESRERTNLDRLFQYVMNRQRSSCTDYDLDDMENLYKRCVEIQKDRKKAKDETNK